jgi:hypothetical protein
MVDEEASYLYDLKIPERQKKRIEWKFTKLHMSELNWLLSSSQSNSELSNFDISLGKCFLIHHYSISLQRFVNSIFAADSRDDDDELSLLLLRRKAVLGQV